MILFLTEDPLMPRAESDHPTGLELDLLKVLWAAEAPLTVREARERLERDAGRALAHSSVITMLNIMHRKGFVRRKAEGKAFLFAAKVTKERVAGRMMRDLVARVFDGSAKALALNLLNSADLDTAELAELRALINRKAKEQQS
jgi:BlaI family transcriptional regulator, penicillinase repressor